MPGRLSAATAAPAAAAAPAPAPGGGADYATPGPPPNRDTGPWYQPGIPREIAMELLDRGNEGAFIIRDSSSQPGNLALTIKADSLMHHYIVRKVPEGWILGSADQGQLPVPDLATLVMAYSRARGCLPHTLNLDTFNKLDEVGAGADDDDDATSFVDPDYQAMKDLALPR